MLKKLFFVLTMLLLCIPAALADDSNGLIELTLNSGEMLVNGEAMRIDADPAVVPQVKGAGYTMLPLRAIVEAMGGEIIYDLTFSLDSWLVCLLALTALLRYNFHTIPGWLL